MEVGPRLLWVQGGGEVAKFSAERGWSAGASSSPPPRLQEHGADRMDVHRERPALPTVLPTELASRATHTENRDVVFVARELLVSRSC